MNWTRVISPPCEGGVQYDTWFVVRAGAWLIDKTQVLYFSSRFLILKNKTSLAALCILLL